MKTPYDILDITLCSSDGEIKQAYLTKVKQFPPDHHQQQFQLIHQAYEAIKDSNSRIQYELFHLPEADFNVLLDQAFRFEPTSSIGSNQIGAFFKTSVDEQTFKTIASKVTKTT